MSFLRQFFGVQTVGQMPVGGEGRLRRALGPVALIAVGLGATIGTGLFVFAGQVAAKHTGPAITLSLVVAAVVCALAAMCYAEFASFVPVSGSAYSYAYATLGEGVAWFIGWNLMLEYVLSASAVAVSWSAYVANLLKGWGIDLPHALINAPIDAHGKLTGDIINVPAILITLVMSWICYVGIRKSSIINSVMVYLKVGVIVLFVLFAMQYVDTNNWHPYIPENTGEKGSFGWSGIMTGAALILFSYIGFDTASTTALESRNPKRDVAIGVLGALIISCVLYLAMSAVLTGIVPYATLDADEPVAAALDALAKAHPGEHFTWIANIVKIGIIAGMTSVILMSLLGQPRILLAMADDGLLPQAMSRCHEKYKTPHVATIVTGIFGAAVAGIFPLDALADLISIGILLAFAVVCAGVLILRYTRPDHPRPFRVPFAPVTCTLGTLLCLGTSLFLSDGTWIRLLIWTVLGFAIYGFYGYWNSRLHNAGRAADREVAASIK
jgi:APA family basic amino acid/polyamine antiporter